MPIGNDIVDLLDPEAQLGALHPRFATRICGAEERDALARADEPARLLWAYWAAKESAYKALRKLIPDLIFAPRQFAVELTRAAPGQLRGSVYAANRQVRVRLRYTRDYVHGLASVVGDDGAARAPTPVAAAARRIGQLSPALGSAAARALLTRALACRVGCARAAIDIARPARRGVPPTVRIDGVAMPVDVSLSHHGRFVAAAYAIPVLRT